MNQKIVEGPYSHSAQLYDLYQKGKEACSNYQVEIHKLAEQIGQTRNILELSDAERRSFEKVFKSLELFSNEWYQSIMRILKQVPQTSLQARFSTTVKISTYDLQVLYPQYDLTGYLKPLVRSYEKLRTNVERLPDIMARYDEYQFDSVRKGQASSNVVYRLTYDEMSGVLYINGIAVHRCNLDSELDKVINEGIRKPGKRIPARGNLRAAVHRTSIPKPLQKLMFRTSKGVIRIYPEITTEDLRKHEINRDEIDAELQQLLNTN